MHQLIEEFKAVCAERPFDLLEQKSEGKKICEYTGRYVPEEIIYAAGMNAYPMWRGGEPEPPDAVLDESVRFLNPYARTQYGLLKLSLDPVAEEADVYAFSLTDCHTYRICELIEHAGYPVCKVGVPSVWLDDNDLDYYANKVDHLKLRLEEASGVKIKDSDIETAIRLYNKIRSLLRQINEARKLPNPPIKGSEFVTLNHCAMSCDPEVAVEYLEKAIDICRSAQADAPEKKRPRIAIFGHVIAQGDYIAIKAFEEAGADIVCEILDDGRFEFGVDVEECSSDPTAAIVRNRYRDVLPNNNMQPSWELRREKLMNAVEDYNVDGVVFYDTLYDEIYNMEYSCMADFLSEKGLPLVRITTSYEYTREAMGPLNTRVETFVETLQGRK